MASPGGFSKFLRISLLPGKGVQGRHKKKGEHVIKFRKENFITWVDNLPLETNVVLFRKK